MAAANAFVLPGVQHSIAAVREEFNAGIPEYLCSSAASSALVVPPWAKGER